MRWHELTTVEIATLDRELPIVVPLGSCEQHGRHLPLFVDSLQVEEIARRIDARLHERVAILPTLWLGASHHHLDFPGTISLRPSLYGEAIQEMTRCILQHGFRRIFFLNGHGGNLVPVSNALSELICLDERADAASITLSSWWQVASSAMAPGGHGMETPRLTHACEYETSMILAIREDLVKLSKIDAEHAEVARPWSADPRWSGKVEGFYRFHRWTSSGHMGRPEAATKEKGNSLLEAVVETLVEFLIDFSSWPHLTAMGCRS